jgi:hypothetical protein
MSNAQVISLSGSTILKNAISVGLSAQYMQSTTLTGIEYD